MSDGTDPSGGDDPSDPADGGSPADLPEPTRPSNPQGGGEITVVGTAHVSEASVEEVEETIADEQPDMVAVELDEGRYRQMRGETPDDLDPGDLLRGNTVFQFLAYWMLSYVQSRLGDQFDIEPGAELLAAVETAEDHGIGVALVDREIRTTIQRFWARLTLVEKFRMLGGLAFGVTDPRVAGVTFGLAVGLLLGPVLGIFGGAIGVTTALLTTAAAGGIAAVVVGYVVLEATAAAGDDGVVIPLAAGLAAGLVAGVGGVGTGLIADFLSPFVIRMVGSLTLGLLVGLGVGGLVGVVVEAFGLGLASDHEEFEEFEEFDPEELTDTDVVTAMMEEFREFSPGGAEALIDERDAYIAHQLVGLREAGYHVVAVVGAGHREGIERYLADPRSLPPMESVTGTASKRGIPWGKIVGFGITVAFVSFFVLLAMAGVRDGQLLRLFGAWFLINGVFAAGLAKVAGARWTSASVGGLVAWMTSINPLLAPGWFAGYMELRHLRVNVADISTLNELLSDETRPIGDILSDMLDVPLFRLIVVVAMTNVGSVIASILFATYVLPAFSAQLDAGVTELMLRGARRSAELVWGAVSSTGVVS